MTRHQTPAERSFTELFQRLPTEPLPLGFRDAVMARLARGRSRRWEWIVAAVIAIPNLAFLVWELLDRGGEFTDAVGGLVNALLGTEPWDASSAFYVDGLLILAVAFVGLAGTLLTHALLAGEPVRSRVRVA